MAKQIKIIKCPSCGGVEKKTIKDEHFQCINCGADYFLDNDDVNINVNYKHHNGDPLNNMSTPEARLVARGFRTEDKNNGLYIVAVVVVGALITYMFMSKEEKASSRPSTPVVTQLKPTKNIQPEVTQTPKFKENYSSPIREGCFVYQQDDGLMLYRMDEYTKKSADLTGNPSSNIISRYQITQYDLANKTRMAIADLGEASSVGGYKEKWDSYRYENDIHYFFKNKKEVWRFDPKLVRAENVTDTLLQDYPQYASGIAEVSFRHNARDGYNSIYVMTNNGKSLHFFPDLNQAYEDNTAFQMRKEGPKRDPATLKRVGKDDIQIGYTFAHNYEKNNKLIQYQYKTLDGLSRKADFISAREDKEGQKNYALGNIYPINSQWILVKDKNISEGAFYHEPSVVYFDDQTLLIATKRSVSSDAERYLQSIHPESGDVLWSVPIRKGQFSPLGVKVEKYHDGFIVGYEKNSCEGILLINNQGEVTHKVDLDSFVTIEK